MIELMLLLSLVLFFIAIRKPFKEKVLGALDSRSEKIRHELDEAQRLHEEAKAMLARYQRQLHEGEKLAEEIIARAETERQRMEARMRADLEALNERRTQQALERIAQEEARALAEVRARAADLAVRATREVMTERLSGDQAGKLMQGAIEEVTRKLA